MNFLQINASDIRWGASLTAFRFHKALVNKGYGSHVLCGLKESSDKNTTQIIPTKGGYIPNAISGKFFNAFGLQSFGYPSSFFFKNSNLINKWADVIILRNLHWWYISIGILPYLAKKAPLIWRLSDMWPLTGHCTYSYECRRWLTGCGSCPHLYDYPKLYLNTTHCLWKRKKRIYKKLKNRLVFVSPSLWLKEMVEKSPLTKDFRCEYIPTAVDLNLFKPLDKKFNRKELGITEKDKVVMASSVKLSDKRKGMNDIVEVVNNLAEEINNLTLLLVGKKNKELNFSSKIKVINTGYIDDDSKLASCYSAADAYLSMSKADNLPNSLVEAASCGLPIVTLDRGGCKETIIEGKTGYAVKNKQEAIESLSAILTNPTKQKQFSLEARDYAEIKFSMDAQVDAYLKLAQDLVLNSKKQHQLKNKSYCHIGGVRIDSTSYKDAISKILDLTQEEKGANIIIANAHLVYEARKNKLKDIINSAELVTPDGLPLLWAQKLSEMKKGKKVSGPDLFPLLCKEAEKKKIPVGFYGAKEDILDKLIKKIKREFPNLDLRYSYSPPFRPLTDAEDQKVIRDINRSGAKILFVGLGCPKQEIWAGMHKHKINAVMVTVGAAFDFIAGSKKRAPKWMQKAGLEWLYRLITEPRRLWRRYLVGNSYFMYLLSKKIIKKIFSNKRKNKYEN